MKKHEKKILLIVDTSGSMEESIGSLNRALELLIQSLEIKYEEKLNIKLGIITYGNEVDMLFPFMTASDINLIPLKAEGNKSFLEAIELYQNEISSIDENPTIVLFSDGYFDEKVNFTKLLDDNSKLRDSKRIAIGIGSGYNEESLEKFSSNSEVNLCEDIYDVELFKKQEEEM